MFRPEATPVTSGHVGIVDARTPTDFFYSILFGFAEVCWVEVVAPHLHLPVFFSSIPDRRSWRMDFHKRDLRISDQGQLN